MNITVNYKIKKQHGTMRKILMSENNIIEMTVNGVKIKLNKEPQI